jgi:hypothetical protein
MAMCETCHVPRSSGSRVSRAASLTRLLLVFATIGALAAVALGQDSRPGPKPRARADADRVFLDDMARQAADAKSIAAQAADLPLLADLARSIESQDRRIAGASAGPPAREPLRSGHVRSVRDAIRRHVGADRIIARVALETGTGAKTTRAAAALLRASEMWSLPPRSRGLRDVGA